ncbi:MULTISPECIES: response regulator transcription factor [unclassified Paenibacillus]|uniref:response regulator transcription factor n=1 Tax=unclassified Paenibacillus TaxID=185978 RepID=UPI0009A8103E|nr:MULTISPECIES: response regulator transcription factor [unclassified Paenibacillus]SLK18534.1 DNA-binding response regulator, OmpR family, contains REC and winged-helix (wHTH) domain [Paenibacillus sp. RU5A]SOC75304.1 DNA-binding response regulator, OmpR family, contains REC and winged-helix (wHTH) domain [Paenibacillus sp. RU26A]SOC77340.1 DNA-binding response regulator, OmpR family, contains REC and winged-helix (wHTH) domain [Paenibacillus sp. RU5M]
MNSKRKILIIEDEHDISRILRDYLTKNQYEAAVAGNGQGGLQMMDMLQPDYIILDIMLPDMDGIDVCREIRRRNNIPILILSARGSDTDKVLGLGFGADDYMTKPFSLSELLARINAHFRRYDSVSAEQDHTHILRLGNLQIDKKAYKVTVDGNEVSLSAKEFELLFHLANHKNQVFSKSQLLDAIWGYAAYGDENTVTVYIRRLREKIEADPSHPSVLKTVWGVGYKFNYE